MGNATCFKCGTQMPGKPILTKPGPQPGVARGPNTAWGQGNSNTKGAGKNSGKGAAKGKGKGKGASTGCSCCGAKAHTKADCKLQDSICDSCGKTGHLAKVCRSSQVPNAKAKSAADFEAEMMRRGYAVVAPPSPPPIEDGHSATTISKKSKAKDAAQAAFDKAVARKALAQESVVKASDDLDNAAKLLVVAEQEFKDEVAATHFATSPPAAKPPALDVQQFMDAKSADDIVVNIGAWFDDHECHPDDALTIETTKKEIIADFAAKLHATFGSFKEKVNASKQVAEASATKKRKANTGTSVPAASPSGSPASGSNPPGDAAATAAAEKAKTEAAAATEKAEKATAVAAAKEAAAKKASATKNAIAKEAKDKATKALAESTAIPDDKDVL